MKTATPETPSAAARRGKTHPPRRAAAVSLALAAAIALAANACAPRYEYRAIPVRPLSGYPGQAQVAGAGVGAVAFYDSRELTGLFGFDLKKAGVVPVQIMIQNGGASPVTLLDGARIEDANGLVWDVLPSDVVHDRINRYTSGSLDGEQGVRRTFMWGLAGAVVGAAVGVATGTNVGEAAGKGAVIGGAAGAAGSILGAGSESTEGQVVRDFSGRSLDHSTVAAGADASGFLYFPSESAQPRRLTLNIEADGQRHTVTLNL
ncbi:MAG: hypothetical protein LBG06_09510 [Deltaproteobacteria bacterium]|jgi:hypothetical protein|nr:hypothetical protein [Deltaproteobacteria bacterium]